MGPGWSRYGQTGTGLLEHRGAVVAQFGHALADVAQRPVGTRLHRSAGERLRIPAPAQLLNRRDVDRPVVEVVFELGKVSGEEAPVGADGVAAQRRRVWLG